MVVGRESKEELLYLYRTRMLSLMVDQKWRVTLKRFVGTTSGVSSLAYYQFPIDGVLKNLLKKIFFCV